MASVCFFARKFQEALKKVTWKNIIFNQKTQEKYISINRIFSKKTLHLGVLVISYHHNFIHYSFIDYSPNKETKQSIIEKYYPFKILHKTGII